MLKKRKYVGSEIARKILAVGLSHAPQLTARSAKMLIPCIIASFLTDAGIQVDPEQIAAVSPSKGTIQNLVMSTSISFVKDLQSQLQEVEYVSMTCNEGNKKASSYFVKVLCWWSKEEKKVVKVVLNINDAEEPSKDAGKETII